MEKIPHPNNPNWQGALKCADPSCGIFELVCYLLKLARTSQLEFHRFADAGVELDSHTLGNDALLETALDLIGVPPDNTVVQVDIHGYPEGFFQDDTFCRDWIDDVFEAMVMKREDYDGFVAAVQNPTEWIPESWSSDDNMEDIIYGDKL